MERNIYLDYFKLFLSFLVIIAHLQNFMNAHSLLDGLINGVARITVPCFFIINAYFAVSIIENGKLIKGFLIKILIINIVWMLIYLPFHIVTPDGFPILIRLFVTFSLGWYHLWYIPALLEGVLLLYVLKRFHIKDEILLFSSLLLYLSGYIIQHPYLFHINIPNVSFIWRNFIFIGFPFIFIGYYIRKKMLIEKKKIRNKTAFIILFFIVLLIESYFTHTFKTKAEFYLIIPFLCPLLFISIMQIKSPAPTIIPVSDNYISKLASFIYFVHILIILFIKQIFTPIDSMILFFPVLFLSMLLSAAVIELNKRIRIFL